MDKQKIGIIAVVCIALAGAIYLTARGIEVPAWLATVIGLSAWVLKSPNDAKKEGAE